MLLYVSSVLLLLPLFNYKHVLPPYWFEVIGLILFYPFLSKFYQMFFQKLHWKRDIEPEFKDHKRKMGDLPPPFPNGWFKICYSWEVEKGQTKYVEALGEHFVVFRGENGKIAILNAYCPHLGANLGYGGKVEGDCIVCPFHAWKFDQKGKCVEIPYNEGQVPSTYQTKSWKSDETNGQILVWYHIENEEPHYYQIKSEDIDDGTLKFHGLTEQYLVCHVQEVPENGCDFAHLNVVHKQSVITDNPIIQHYWEATWKPGENDLKHTADVCVNESLKFCGLTIPFSRVTANITQLGPGLVNFKFNTPLGLIKVFQTVTPIRPLYTRVDHIVYGDWKIPRFIPKIFVWNIGCQVEKDVVIWSNKTYNVNPLLCKNDGKVTTFRRWFSQFYSKNSITYKQYREKMMDW